MYHAAATNMASIMFCSLKCVKEKKKKKKEKKTFLLSLEGSMLSDFLTNFGGLYLTEFLTDFGQILDSNSYYQAQQTL